MKKDIDAAEGKRLLAQRFEEYRSDMEEDFEMTLEDFIGVYEDEPECIGDGGSVTCSSVRGVRTRKGALCIYARSCGSGNEHRDIK